MRGESSEYINSELGETVAEANGVDCSEMLLANDDVDISADATAPAEAVDFSAMKTLTAARKRFLPLIHCVKRSVTISEGRRHQNCTVL